MNNLKSDILPFCIYNNAKSNNTYMSRVLNSQVNSYLQDGNKRSRIVCLPTINNWELISTFYAINPIFRPIPVGMKIFCAEINQSYPYNTIDVTLMYDPYNIKQNCTYFITYSQPVPNTVPLYFHKQINNVVASFNPNPPTYSNTWTQTQISPIYVMTKETVGHNYNNIKFICNNGSCLPFTKPISDMFYFNKRYPTNLSKCVEECNDYFKKLLLKKPLTYRGVPKGSTAPLLKKVVSKRSTATPLTQGITRGRTPLVGVPFGIINRLKYYNNTKNNTILTNSLVKNSKQKILINILKISIFILFLIIMIVYYIYIYKRYNKRYNKRYTS